MRVAIERAIWVNETEDAQSCLIIINRKKPSRRMLILFCVSSLLFYIQIEGSWLLELRFTHYSQLATLTWLPFSLALVIIHES